VIDSATDPEYRKNHYNSLLRCALVLFLSKKITIISSTIKNVLSLYTLLKYCNFKIDLDEYREECEELREKIITKPYSEVEDEIYDLKNKIEESTFMDAYCIIDEETIAVNKLSFLILLDKIKSGCVPPTRSTRRSTRTPKHRGRPNAMGKSDHFSRNKKDKKSKWKK